MKFNYKKLTKGLDRPIVRIELKNPRSQQQISFLALVDSGADICLMPGDLATLIGIDVAAGERRDVGGVVAGERRPYYLHDIDLGVGGVFAKATVGFMTDLAPNGYGLLGQRGFFDRFSFVKFEHAKGTVEVGQQV